MDLTWWKQKKEQEWRYMLLVRAAGECSGRMIRSPTIYICADCMQKAFEIMSSGDNPYMSMINLPLDFHVYVRMGSTRFRRRGCKAERKEEWYCEEIDYRKIPSPHIIKAKAWWIWLYRTGARQKSNFRCRIQSLQEENQQLGLKDVEIEKSPKHAPINIHKDRQDYLD